MLLSFHYNNHPRIKAIASKTHTPLSYLNYKSYVKIIYTTQIVQFPYFYNTNVKTDMYRTLYYVSMLR